MFDFKKPSTSGNISIHLGVVQLRYIVKHILIFLAPVIQDPSSRNEFWMVYGPSGSMESSRLFFLAYRLSLIGIYVDTNTNQGH